jgi:hypothetical protein
MHKDRMGFRMVALIKGVENKIKIVLGGLGQGVQAGWPARGQGDGERRGSAGGERHMDPNMLNRKSNRSNYNKHDGPEPPAKVIVLLRWG